MSVKDWKTVDECKSDGFVFGWPPPPRNKEQLIAARGKPETSVPWGTPACMLAVGNVSGAVDMLVQHAGRQWAHDTLSHFDLRRVDEQGRLIEAGEMPLRPRVFEVSAPSGQKAAEDAATGKVSLRVGIEVAPPKIAWEAGEYLDHVLARGAEEVRAHAATALKTHFAEDVVPKERYRVMDALGVSSSKAVDAEGSTEATAAAIREHLTPKPPPAAKEMSRGVPITATVSGPFEHVEPAGPTLDKATVDAWFRKRNLTAVPALEWGDVRAWLLSVGCKLRERPRYGDVCIAYGDHTKDGWMLVTNRPEDVMDLIDRLAHVFGRPARDIRRSIVEHATTSAARSSVGRSARAASTTGPR